MARTYRKIVTGKPHHKNAIPYVRRGNKMSIDIDDVTIEIERTPKNRHSY